MLRPLLIAAAFISAPCAAQNAQPLDGNPEMAAIFAADQQARQGPVGDVEAFVAGDEQRRSRTRELLDAGELTSANDFYAAAFVFQHGDGPDDYLLAHVLAVRALGLGHRNAEWIAAATLDRYLRSIESPQIYGTQFHFSQGEDASQEPYNKELLTDQIRLGAGVPTIEEQRQQMIEMEEMVRSMIESQGL